MVQSSSLNSGGVLSPASGASGTSTAPWPSSGTDTATPRLDIAGNNNYNNSTGVIIINILRSLFCQYPLAKKSQSQTVIREKLRN